jgi:hypothetical protein
MTIASLSVVLQSCAGLLVLGLVCFWMYPAVRLDEFRQDLFSIRDELFDYAASGRISFSDPAYRLLRQSMNGFIRYAHQVTVFRIVMAFLVWKVTGTAQANDWTRQWDCAVSAIPDSEIRSKLIEFHQRLNNHIADRVVSGSPILIALALICATALLFSRGWHSVREVYRRAVIKTAARTINQRRLEEEAMMRAAA